MADIIYDLCLEFLREKLSTDPKWAEFGLLLLTEKFQKNDLILLPQDKDFLVNVMGYLTFHRHTASPGRRLPDKTRVKVYECLGRYNQEVLDGIVDWFSPEYVKRFNQKALEWRLVDL